MENKVECIIFLQTNKEDLLRSIKNGGKYSSLIYMENKYLILFSDISNKPYYITYDICMGLATNLSNKNVTVYIPLNLK